MESKTMRVKEIAEVLLGHQVRAAVEPVPGGSHYLLQIRDFNEERTAIDAESMIRFFPPSVKDEQVLRDGDVVFLAKGGKHFGFAVEGLPRPCLVASYFFVLRPRIDVSSAYMAWFLTQDASRRYFARNSGTTAHMPVVRRGVLENLSITLPSLDVQRSIAELDGLIVREQSLYNRLAEKKKLVWTSACLKAASMGNLQEDENE